MGRDGGRPFYVRISIIAGKQMETAVVCHINIPAIDFNMYHFIIGPPVRATFNERRAKWPMHTFVMQTTSAYIYEFDLLI